MTLNYFRRMRGVPRDAWLVMPMMATHLMGYYGIFAVAFNLYLVRLGYGPEFIGRANSIPPLIFAISAFPAGMLSRIWSSRRLMWVGKLLEALSIAAIAIASLLSISRRPAWILGALGAMGVGGALWVVHFYPLLLAVAGPEERDRAFAVSSAVGTSAVVCGNLLGGALPGLIAAILGISLAEGLPFGLTVAMGGLLELLAIPLFLCVGATADVPDEKHVERKSRFPLEPIAAMSMALLLLHGARVTGVFFLNVYLDTELHAPPALIGALAGVPRLVSIPASLAIPWVVAKWGRMGAIQRLNGVRLLGFLLWAGVAHWIAAGAGQLVQSVVGMMGTLVTLYSLEQVAPEWRSTMSGATNLALGVGMAAMAFLGGTIVATWGYSGLFGSAALLTIALGLVLWVYARGHPEGGTHPSASSG